MTFNSYEFILWFLPITIIGYYFLGHIRTKTCAKIWLLLASVFFYGYASKVALITILLSLVINFGIAILISRGILLRKLCLGVGLLLNIGFLVFCKYTDFIITNINATFSMEYTLLNLAVPLGLSFYTFKQISYLVDTYKDGGALQCSFLDYANYILFFPEIFSGPISLYDESIRQMRGGESKMLSPEQ